MPADTMGTVTNSHTFSDGNTVWEMDTEDGFEGQYRLSQFADPVPESPEEGEVVWVRYDEKGKYRYVSAVWHDGEEAPAGKQGRRGNGDQQATARAYRPPPAQYRVQQPQPVKQPYKSKPSGPDRDREVRITRMACLNTATNILGGGAGREIDPLRVTALAYGLERWVISDDSKEIRMEMIPASKEVKAEAEQMHWTPENIQADPEGAMTYWKDRLAQAQELEIPESDISAGMWKRVGRSEATAGQIAVRFNKIEKKIAEHDSVLI